jgi:Regulator of chromosome condensation (RCC1) repeat
MRRSLLLGLSLVVACNTDAAPKNKPVAAPAVEEGKPVMRPPPSEEVLQPMTAAATFSAVVAGSEHSCGITESADLYCWGRSNGNGQLGTSAHKRGFQPEKLMFAEESHP